MPNGPGRERTGKAAHRESKVRYPPRDPGPSAGGALSMVGSSGTPEPAAGPPGRVDVPPCGLRGGAGHPGVLDLDLREALEERAVVTQRVTEDLRVGVAAVPAGAQGTLAFLNGRDKGAGNLRDEFGRLRHRPVRVVDEAGLDPHPAGAVPVRVRDERSACDVQADAGTGAARCRGR